jgi:tetratricopeptide (TPR) repeat protein
MEEQERHQPPTDIGLDEATNLLDQGRVYYDQGDFKEALSCLHLAHDRYRVDGERGQIAEVANDLGVVYTVLRRWEEADKWLDQAYRLFGEIGDLAGKAQTLGNRGSMYRARGEWQEAAASLKLSADHFHVVGDDEQRAVTLRSLSLVRLRQFRPMQALAAYHAALDCRPNPTWFQRLLKALFGLPLRAIQG